MSIDPQYEVQSAGFWAGAQMAGTGGYGTMDVALRLGWWAIPSWGRDGWNLGSWPLAVVYHHDEPGNFGLVEYVEGDVTTWSFPTREMRDEATDRIALWHWQHRGEDWVKGIESLDQMPDHLRGPYSPQRLALERQHGEAHLE